MHRGMGIVLVLGMIIAALFAAWTSESRSPYFDPALYKGSYPCTLDYDGTRGAIDTSVEDWFAKPLRRVSEPSLYFSKPPAGTTTLRFTFLPAFVEPVVVRIDDLYGEQPRLTATRVVDQVIVREGPDHITRDLAKAEVEPIIAFLASSRVLNLPPDSCLSGIDGVVFLIEANGPGGYRFINRWGVSDGPVYDLGNMMFDLTGWSNGRQGPDRGELGRPYTDSDGRRWPRPDPVPAPEI
ncbi:hypothetical protein [Brevundimonas lenta]|uniref:Uncharacterized protein n=1 Tax=Brevundimonas lenta TaxID=424796 RepID=A0A7W6NNX3_9CAUL|nr:hypothetical protein [Brevundimonas lenta]MBB4081605.1 hypothetical protein [Brevundimonas lenta]